MGNRTKKKKDRPEGLILPTQGGFRKLLTFRLARLIYDLTVRFCNRYVSRYSRTHDQMVQAARSGVQNIAEGSAVSGTSKKSEMILVNVARGSLMELRLDYEDFLRQNGLTQWETDDPRRRLLVQARCKTPNEVARWVRDVGMIPPKDGPDGQKSADRTYRDTSSSKETSPRATPSIRSIQSIRAEASANAILVLIEVTIVLLGKQLEAQMNDFRENGGFGERLYRIQSERKREKG